MTITIKYKPLLTVFLLANIINCPAKESSSDAVLDPADFQTPKTESGPHVWWHWVGYNVEKDGITKDLESMKNAGIAGATLFQLVSTATDRYPPVGNSYSGGIDYFNEKWWSLIRHSAAEAKRLGLELGMHNCIGWSVSGGPWIKAETAMQQVVWSEIKVQGPRHFAGYIDQPPCKLNYYKDIAVLLVPEGEPMTRDILDISDKMQADGKIICTIPKGNYTIYRFGHTPTGSKPTSAPENIKALEADKMSAVAMTLHMRNILDPFVKNAGDYLGSTITYMLFDSYEAGDQNWTTLMRSEFLSRKGYDIIPWLPVLAGRIMEGKEATDAFKWDLKTVISDMFIEYSYNIPKKMLNELGMQIQIEPYATGPANVPRPFNTFDAAHLSEMPTTEFWTRMRKIDIDKWHVNAALPFFGRNILSAEAFTGNGAESRWSEAPARLKFSGDVAFSKGVNRMILHHWVHQPFPDNIMPGMCMGPWGTHFGRNQTWYEPGKAWIAYLGRSQYLLQKGEKVSDFISLDEYIAGGDVISEKTLLNYVTVENGKLVSPVGRKYHFLAVNNNGALSKNVLIKLEQLVSQGATILGTKPASPKGYKDLVDAPGQFDEIAGRLWGKNPASAFGKNTYKGGMVMWGIPAEEALKRLNVAPSVAIVGETDDSLCWSHRQCGNVDIFYFANTEAKTKNLKVSLRAGGRSPEIWDPESGDIQAVAVWHPVPNGTEVLLHFKPNQALFVVFQKKITQERYIAAVDASPPGDTYTIATTGDGRWFVKAARPGKFKIHTACGQTLNASVERVPAEITLGGKWNVTFKSPLGRAFSSKFGKLESWTLSSDENIKYFSGTAVYSNTFHIPNDIIAENLSIHLNLGIVKELASITLNGKSVAVLWHAPYEVDITPFLKSGINEISIAVTNTWANRLIGDNNFPDDCEWGDNMGPEGRALLRYPKWLVSNRPRPSSERMAFSSWNYFDDKSPLLDAGLLSDIKLEFRRHAYFENETEDSSL